MSGVSAVCDSDSVFVKKTANSGPFATTMMEFTTKDERMEEWRVKTMRRRRCFYGRVRDGSSPSSSRALSRWSAEAGTESR